VVAVYTSACIPARLLDDSSQLFACCCPVLCCVDQGTHVAGTVAARNNGAGVVGMSPGLPIYSLKASSAGVVTRNHNATRVYRRHTALLVTDDE